MTYRDGADRRPHLGVPDWYCTVKKFSEEAQCCLEEPILFLKLRSGRLLDQVGVFGQMSLSVLARSNFEIYHIIRDSG